MSSQSFAALGASRAVVGALSARGIHEPFAVQKLVIGDVLAGHDVLCQSPTGSGKTLAFGVPIADRISADGPKQAALILAPTRELACQIVDELRDVCHARALSVAAVYGGAGIERQSKAARRAHILVATPGRLEDLIARGTVSLKRIRILVLDEADRMLDMGFKPAVDRIVGDMPSERQTLFFSATLQGEVGGLAKQYTRDPRRHQHAAAPERRGDVEHRFLAVSHDAKLKALVSTLRNLDRGRTLVFVRTKRGADRLVKRLRAQNVTALAMHGNKSQSQRENALARFEDGHTDTLVATDVAARGLDVDDITHVINFDAPGDHDGYTHRVGRTGRAGRTGTGITFVSHDQAGDVQKIAHALSLHSEWEDSGLARRGSQTPVKRNGNRNGGRSGNRNRGRRSRTASRH
jgi:ATP-dependent RNA helicase RhlE